jgi:hypothetical protein
MVAAGCLLAGATGCQCQRKGRGFILRSQWSLEYGDTDGAVVEKPCENGTTTAVNPPYQAKTSPELLPWRDRLKNRRLADRLFRRGETDAVKSPAQETTLAATDSRRWQPPPPATPILPESPHDDKTSRLAAKPTEIRVSGDAHAQSAVKRPDLVLE